MGWKKIYDSTTPETEPLLKPWNESLTRLEELIVLRCLRPDKVTSILCVWPETEPLLKPWNESLTRLEELIVLRCLRPDKVITTYSAQVSWAR